ncbi:hypothetical protein [Bdellovibrio sp. HCB274]|uniref:hypothetical protein n=1 Tax=Bdellovibrio sp. HCB274 TaxID=3394361 RepID=UPI0039B5BDEB
MTAKIILKMGDLEFNFEGSENFIKEELVELMTSIKGLLEYENKKIVKSNAFASGAASSVQQTLGINSVAQKLKVKDGKDLVLASAAKISIFGEKIKFTSKDLLLEMRSAVSYFKESYATNLNRQINRMTKEGILNDVGGGYYSLPIDQLKGLQEILLGGDHTIFSDDKPQDIKPLSVPLVKLIKINGFESNQVGKFLAATYFLTKKGVIPMKTSDVTSALRTLQIRLTNATECLNKNIKKGYIEKVSSHEFIVTDDGEAAIRIKE